MRHARGTVGTPHPAKIPLKNPLQIGLTSGATSVMLNERPLVSIGLPVYNGERYLCAALDALLTQDYERFELIVSDNASTDGTAEICRAYVSKDKRIRYFRNETNLGSVKNFSRVLELSIGKYFMWAAHDDLWTPDCINKLVCCLEQDPEFVLCASDVKFIDENGNFLRLERLSRIYTDKNWARARKLFFEYPTSEVLHAIYGLYRTEYLKRCEAPSLNWRGFLESGETPILAQLATMGTICAVPYASKYYRVHADSNYRKELRTKTHLDHLLISLDVVRKLLTIVSKSDLRGYNKVVLLNTIVCSWVRSFARAVGRRSLATVRLWAGRSSRR